MPNKKIKRKSKRKYSRKGDTAKHGSSINKINIRIMSPPQTSSTPAVHPDSYALAEQSRLHLSAVQQIVLDNHKPPIGTITPIKTNVVVSPFHSGTVRGELINPFNRPSSAPVLPEVRVARGASPQVVKQSPSPEIQPASSGRTLTPPHRLRDVSVEPEDYLSRNMRIPAPGEVKRYYHPWLRRPEGLLGHLKPLQDEITEGYMPVEMSPTKSKLTDYPTNESYALHMGKFYDQEIVQRRKEERGGVERIRGKGRGRPRDILGGTQGF